MAEEKKKDKKQRIMSVIEIGDGDLLTQLQDAYNEANTLALKYRAKFTLKLQVTVGIPQRIKTSKGETMTGMVSFEVTVPQLKRKSMEYQTELDDDGNVVAQGADLDDLFQEKFIDKLYPEEKKLNIAPFKKEVASGE
jgi:hypothetical protein